RIDPDDGKGVARELERASDDLRVAVELPPPALVAEHDDAIAGDAFVLGTERAAEDRLDAEEPRHARRHPLSAEDDGLLDSGKRQRRREPGADFFEDLCPPLPPIEVLRI